MVLDELRLEGFRNYDGFSASFSPGINVISGRNAQGKTNLLEAVCLLSQGKSHRGARENELIGFNRDSATIAAKIHTTGRNIELEMQLGPRRRILRNGVQIKKRSELSGTLTSVMFEPSDLELVKGAPARRRSELDSVISQLRPMYFAALSEFNKLYAGKLRILKNHRDTTSLIAALDDYNSGLCKAGARLIFYRISFVKKLAGFANTVHFECSGGLEQLGIEYRTERGIDIERPDRGAIYEALTERQRLHRNDEINAGRCLVGAQRDDLHITINGLDAKSFASQGQTRTAALSLKLAERDLISDDTGEAPVLLLDDVLSELDAKRREFVLSRITGGQVLITTAEETGGIAATTCSGRDGKTLVIEGGKIAGEYECT